MQRISITNPQNIIDGTAKKYYFKLRNTGGPKGDKGEKGDKGDTGAQGPQGDPCTVVVNSTATLEPGSNAYVTNTGSLSNAVLNFGIPKGDRGPQGDKGDKGDTGAQGETGPRGPQGERGTNATVSIGTTYTLNPGAQATVYNSGSDSNAVLNFGIPKGEKGDTGSQGPTGPAGQNFAPTIVAELPATGDESKLYLTPKAHTSQTATGNPITATITDGAGAIESFQLDGDTFQQSYEGKNLLKLTPQASASNGITATLTNSIITYSGTASSNWANIAARTYNSIPAGDYMLSMQETFATNYAYAISVTYTDNTTATFECWKSVSNKRTVTFGKDVASYYIYLTGLTSGTSYSGTISLMLEAGSTATTPFEPYVGGQPSPNPDYPQPIQTVTGEQTVEIIGKNLAKMANGAYSYSAAGQTFTLLDGSIRTTRTNASYQGGAINISTGSMAQWAVVCASDSHLTSSGGTYTLTFSRTGDVTPSSSAARVCIYGFIYDDDGNNTSGNGQLLVDLSSQTSGTYTLNLATDRHLGALVMYSQFISYSDVELKVQLEIGSSASSFEPYQEQSYEVNLGNIELCKLGTYQDYIWKDGEDWKVHKKITKYVCDSTLNWTWDASVPRLSANSVTLGLHVIGPINADTAVIGKTNKFVANSFNYVFTQKNNGFAYSPSGFISCVDKEWGSESEAKADILGSIFYFVLQGGFTTDTTITDTTLISQLEAIRTASLQNGTNTITNTAIAPNLAGDMEIGYYGYNPTNRYDKFIWLELNNNYEQIGS